MKASFDDLSALQELEIACFPDPWSEKSLLQILGDEKYLVLMHRDESELTLGYLIGWHIGDEAELARIGVLPGARGQGIGRKLLDEALGHWQREKVARVFLEVRSSNFAALALYRSCGFEAIATRTAYYENGENALVLRREALDSASD